MATERDNAQHEVAFAISNAMSRLFREYFGRGPRDARTFLADGHVLCVLEDIFTPMEKGLIAAGRFETVRASRAEFQAVRGELFTSAVEQATGRRVLTYMSQTTVDPDIGIEFFLLGEHLGPQSHPTVV